MLELLLRGFVAACDALLWVFLRAAVGVALVRDRMPRRLRRWRGSIRKLVRSLLHGRQGLGSDRSAALVHRHPWNRTSAVREEEICRLHVALPEFGAGQLRPLCERVLGFRPCRQTIRAILIRRKELVAELRQRRHPRRIWVSGPRHLWGVDLTLVWILGFWPVWVFAAVDYFGSRVVSLEVLSTPSTAKVMAALDAAFLREGAPARVLSDRGGEFSGGEFAAFVAARGVEHTRTLPAHPWTNGRVERLFGTFKMVLRRYLMVPRSVGQLAGFCGDFREWHNVHRPHSSWDGRTPDEVFFRRLRPAAPLGRIRFFDGQLHWWRFG